MSSSTYPILSTTIPLYNTLIDHTKEIINTENIISIKAAAEKCKEKLLEISSIYNTFYTPTLSEVSNKNESFEQKNSIIEHLFKKCCIEKIDKLQVYLSLPTVNETVNSLEWWKSNMSQFPHLSKIACDHLSIPATSVSSEQCFSISKNLITDNRNRLAGKTVRVYMCLRSW
ncbi:2480_t:CDS:2 [Diversispora eburnea]|uniref:2480_t:CDS:1 n=1 Tax=Diversispora eburnea TaxID=1213867 RepID=A0A9N9ACA5_9GLOM|nr:2480_t:CDS:2 [Diversispora eburnea]